MWETYGCGRQGYRVELYREIMKYKDIMLNCDLSDNALYKMYGNSIVVDCMVHMFDKLFINRNEPKKKDIQLW